MEKLELKDYILMITDNIGRMETVNVPDFPDGMIPKHIVLDIIQNCKKMLEDHNDRLPKTYTKIMYVEDGSVDVAELKSELPDTKIIVYRQGACMPELKDVQSNPIKGY